MSAKKQLYKAVREVLLNKTGVEHCRLYNSQFDSMEQEDTFPFPCAFIEFAQLDYVTKSEGLQEAETRLRIYVGFESLATEELDILDLMEDIHGDLQGFHQDDLFTPLNRVFEGQDVNHDNVIVWIMDYETLLTDVSGHRNNKLVKTKIDELCVDVDTTTEASKPRLGRL